MPIIIIRSIAFVILLAVLLVNLTSKAISGEGQNINFWAIVAVFIGAILAFVADILTPKKSLSNLAGLFFALLVGVFISWGLSPVIDMIDDIYKIGLSLEALHAIKWMVGICICYLVVSIVMRTKDDVRFVIPYVEFAKQTKGARPLVLDTSAIIDGRIAELYHSKLFDAPLVVPRFVLNELQLLSDSADKLKRNRGRRGLDILENMQNNKEIDITIDDTVIQENNDLRGVDQKLVVFTSGVNGRLVTTDFNLTKVAQVRNVDVLNINNLANSLKTIALPGERMKVKIIRPGEEQDQGIGYMDDGTMVVVDGGRNKIGKDVNIAITSSLQTSAGKMVFGKFETFAGGREGSPQ